MALLAMMVGICFIPTNAPLPLIGIRSVNIPDLILYALIAVLYGKFLFAKDALLVKTPLDVPITLIVLIATGNLLLRTTVFSKDFFAAFFEYKIIVYLLAATLVVNFYRNAQDLEMFLRGTFLLAAVVSAVLILRALTGHVQAAGIADVGDPLSIYYLFWAQGYLLEFWVFCCMLSLLFVYKVSKWYLLVGVLSLAFLVLSFSRHWWISILFSCVFIFYVTIRQYLKRVFKVLILLLMPGLVFESAALAGVEPFSRYQELVVSRAISLAWIDTTGSYSYRMLENHYAVEVIRKHSLLGIGFQAPFRPQIYFPDDSTYSFIHNGYLWILLKMGVVGFLPFLVLSFIFVSRGLRRWSKVQSPLLRGVALGSVASYLGIALANLAAPHFMQNWEVAFVAISLGVNEAIYHIEDKSQQQLYRGEGADRSVVRMTQRCKAASIIRVQGPWETIELKNDRR